MRTAKEAWKHAARQQATNEAGYWAGYEDATAGRPSAVLANALEVILKTRP